MLEGFGEARSCQPRDFRVIPREESEDMEVDLVEKNGPITALLGFLSFLTDLKRRGSSRQGGT